MNKNPPDRQQTRPWRRYLMLPVLIAPLLGYAAGATAVPADDQIPAPDAALLDMHRGQILYETACVSCHSTQAHWRDESIVSSWTDVITQVDRWQNNAGQNWGAAEIGDVAAYLNTRFYKLPCPDPGCLSEDSTRADPGVRTAHRQ